MVPSQREMTKWERERDLVRILFDRLGLTVTSVTNPNDDGRETGFDVMAQLNDGRAVRVQVTELDPHETTGRARAEEKARHANAEVHKTGVYGRYAQNNSGVILDSLVRSIKGKVKKAGQHSGPVVGEPWLLVCASLPQPGATVSTLVVPSLQPTQIDEATEECLRNAPFERCFFHSIAGPRAALYQWDQHSRRWSVVPHEVDSNARSEPEVSQEYMAALLATRGKQEEQEEMDRLCREETNRILREMRNRSD